MSFRVVQHNTDTIEGLGEDSLQASSPWASESSRARRQSLLAGYGEEDELSATLVTLTLYTFSTLLDLSRSEKNAMENYINVSVRSTSL